MTAAWKSHRGEWLSPTQRMHECQNFEAMATRFTEVCMRYYLHLMYDLITQIRTSVKKLSVHRENSNRNWGISLWPTKIDNTRYMYEKEVFFQSEPLITLKAARLTLSMSPYRTFWGRKSKHNRRIHCVCTEVLWTRYLVREGGWKKLSQTLPSDGNIALSGGKVEKSEHPSVKLKERFLLCFNLENFFLSVKSDADLKCEDFFSLSLLPIDHKILSMLTKNKNS